MCGSVDLKVAQMQLSQLQAQFNMLKPLLDAMLAKIGATAEPTVIYDHEQPNLVFFGYAIEFKDPYVAYKFFKALQGESVVAEERKPGK